MKRDVLLKKLTLIAILSALCCAGTFIQIKMPAGDFVHLGNFVMILAALLLGGVAGGLVGSLGMGIYDLIFYLSKPSTVIRTFVLKFLVGFIVGSLFQLLIKKRANTKPLLIGITAFFAVVFISTTVLFACGDLSGFSKDSFNSIYPNIFGSDRTLKISLYIPIFSFIFTLGTLLATIFEGKLKNRSKIALFAVTAAILVNIIGEFFLRWLLEGLMVSDFTISLMVATSKIPGSLITGLLSVFLVVLIYEPVYNSLAHQGLIDRIGEDEEVAE